MALKELLCRLQIIVVSKERKNIYHARFGFNRSKGIFHDISYYPYTFAVFSKAWYSIKYYQLNSKWLIRSPFFAQNALQQEWGNFPFANWNGICWGFPLQLVQLIEIHFLPHLESFMWERKFEKKFFKKSHIQTPNGVLLIFKLPFPNGSYRNGVCRALWALS